MAESVALIYESKLTVISTQKNFNEEKLRFLDECVVSVLAKHSTKDKHQWKLIAQDLVNDFETHFGSRWMCIVAPAFGASIYVSQ